MKTGHINVEQPSDMPSILSTLKDKRAYAHGIIALFAFACLTIAPISHHDHSLSDGTIGPHLNSDDLSFYLFQRHHFYDKWICQIPLSLSIFACIDTLYYLHKVLYLLFFQSKFPKAYPKINSSLRSQTIKSLKYCIISSLLGIFYPLYCSFISKINNQKNAYESLSLLSREYNYESRYTSEKASRIEFCIMMVCSCIFLQLIRNVSNLAKVMINCKTIFLNVSNFIVIASILAHLLLIIFKLHISGPIIIIIGLILKYQFPRHMKSLCGYQLLIIFLSKLKQGFKDALKRFIQRGDFGFIIGLLMDMNLFLARSNAVTLFATNWQQKFQLFSSMHKNCNVCIRVQIRNKSKIVNAFLDYVQVAQYQNLQLPSVNYYSYNNYIYPDIYKYTFPMFVNCYQFLKSKLFFVKNSKNMMECLPVDIIYIVLEYADFIENFQQLEQKMLQYKCFSYFPPPIGRFPVLCACLSWYHFNNKFG